MESNNVRYKDNMPSWFIDAKELWKRLIQQREQNKESSLAYMVNIGINQAVGLMNSLPPADVVKVVRCKDCKHRGDAEECPMRYFETERRYDCDGHMMLDYFDHDFTKDDGFCDRGERRTDNEKG